MSGLKFVFCDADAHFSLLLYCTVCQLMPWDTVLEKMIGT